MVKLPLSFRDKTYPDGGVGREIEAEAKLCPDCAEKLLTGETADA
jgi:hypothetical protein